MTTSAGFWTRLRRRFKHGLLTQEMLDRMAKIGLVFYPYYLVREMPMHRPEIDAQGAGLEARFLTDSELSEISNIPERPRDLARIRLRLKHGKCFGVWVDGQFAAYSWYSSKNIPAAIGGQPLCPLPPKTIYLYDAFVRPDFRGRQVAGFMRNKLHAALSEEGIENCISISLAFNKSSRRFKSKLGSRESELRLLLSITALGGIDLRIRQNEDFVPTPRIVRLRRFTEPRL